MLINNLLNSLIISVLVLLIGDCELWNTSNIIIYDNFIDIVLSE